MDLYAYAQINELEEIMKANNIEVPRLRGLRLMSKETPEYNYVPSNLEFDVLKDWIASDFGRDKAFRVYSSWTSELAERLSHVSKIDDDGDEVRKINWNMLSRKDKKYLKLEIKHRLKAFHKQFGTFNKYCGNNDVLYIHARIGGNNWNYYDGPKLMEQPWFMEKVDDAFDSTYCDIYAKIKPVGETIDYDADGNRIINYSYEKDNKKIRVVTCSELDDDGNLTGLYHQEISLYVDDKLHTKINQGNDYKTCDEVFNFFERCMTVHDTKETVLINQEIIFNDESYSNEITYQYQNAEGTCAVCQELYPDKSEKPDEITYSFNSKEVKSLPEYIMNDIENSKKILKESDELINEFENAGYFEKIIK